MQVLTTGTGAPEMRPWSSTWYRNASLSCVFVPGMQVSSYRCDVSTTCQQGRLHTFIVPHSFLQASATLRKVSLQPLDQKGCTAHHPYIQGD